MRAVIYADATVKIDIANTKNVMCASHKNMKVGHTQARIQKRQRLNEVQGQVSTEQAY